MFRINFLIAFVVNEQLDVAHFKSNEKVGNLDRIWVIEFIIIIILRTSYEHHEIH